ncbi:hypothetical protein [Azotobacter vinelandii]|uniref:hypothetical protein n=1 Tax=Azotobacter vinelandii TaxID=354 RepID=UPI002665BA8E|nr:hypothetical protein [Azotobacter vinelandii]WKN23945.1 hypothetical protein AVAEIV_002077 [Azotobacter vinelandii]
MLLTGIVVGNHRTIPRYAIQTEEGYVVVDVESGDLAFQHVVIGERSAIEEYGHTTMLNHSTGETVEVFVEAVKATREFAIRLLRE